MTNPLPYPPHPGLNRCPQVLVVLLFFLSLLVTRRSPPRRGTAYRHSQSCGNYTQTSACPLGMLTRHVPHHFQQRPMWLHANSSTDNIPLEKRQFYSIITHTHKRTDEMKVFRAVQVRVLSSIGYMHPNVGR